MNNGLESKGQEAILAHFEALFRHLPGVTEKTTRHLS
jgi:hypothetical protein